MQCYCIQVQVDIIFYVQMQLYIFELKLLLLDTLIPMQFDINTRHKYEFLKKSTQHCFLITGTLFIKLENINVVFVSVPRTCTPDSQFLILCGENGQCIIFIQCIDVLNICYMYSYIYTYDTKQFTLKHYTCPQYISAFFDLDSNFVFPLPN